MQNLGFGQVGALFVQNTPSNCSSLYKITLELWNELVCGGAADSSQVLKVLGREFEPSLRINIRTIP